MTYDLIIIGGGPAACAAAVYAARKQLTTLMIAQEIGGQSSVSNTIFNWIGTPAISGSDLAKSLKSHVEEYTKAPHTLTLNLGKRVQRVHKDGDLFTITTEGSTDTFSARAILIATGSSHRKLEVPGAADFEHKGIMYCATCDGPLFAGQPVAVAGGGNAALEAVVQLAQYASHVTLIHRSESYKADPITVETVSKLPNVTMYTNTDLLEIKGDKFVSSIVFKAKGSTESTELPVQAVFVEIGQIPSTDLVKDVVPLDQTGKIFVDPTNQRTKMLGIWAAGDCTTGLYHQNNIAAGDAVKAIEDLYIWLKTGK